MPSSSLHPLLFLTGSSSKFEEAKAILPDLRRVEIDLPEIQELDQHKVIAAKIEAASSSGFDNIIVEDTGLYLSALEWKLPGPLIKWFLKGIGLNGLSELAINRREAYALTLIGYWNKNLSSPIFFEGRIDGAIVDQRGGGFGWDAIFQPSGESRTLGQMSVEEKNLISHRSNAFRALAAYLAQKQS